MAEEKKAIKKSYFQPKYSPKIVDFIVDKIEGGMTLAEVCREYGPPSSELIPNEKSCYRWKKKYPEFKKALDDAYQTLIFKMMDEMNDLSKESMRLADELKESGNMREAKFEAIRLKGQLDAVKTRIRALEFMLTRIAPKLVPDLKESPAESRIAQLPPINIINYADKPLIIGIDPMSSNNTPRPLICDKENK
jgi:hypothetical protein